MSVSCCCCNQSLTEKFTRKHLFDRTFYFCDKKCLNRWRQDKFFTTNYPKCKLCKRNFKNGCKFCNYKCETCGDNCDKCNTFSCIECLVIKKEQEGIYKFYCQHCAPTTNGLVLPKILLLFGKEPKEWVAMDENWVLAVSHRGFPDW
jgi:hypothetical protein